MKRFLFIPLLLLIGCTSFPNVESTECQKASNTWVEVEKPTTYSFADITINDQGILYTSGMLGEVWTSDDGGHTWTQLSLVTEIRDGIEWTVTLTHISSPEPDIIYTGQEELILSEDNGDTWTTIPSPENFYGRMRGMHFFSKKEGVVATSNGLYHTDDGGESWELTKEVHIRELVFVDEETGYAWTHSQPTSPFPGEAIPATGALYRTKNGGKSWNRLGNSFAGISSVSFYTSTDGFLLDGEKVLFESHNGGRSWDETETNYAGNGSSILFTDPCNGYIGGYDGEIHASRDGGITWKKVLEVDKELVFGLTQTKNGMVAITNGSSVMVGE